MYLHIQI